MEGRGGVRRQTSLPAVIVVQDNEGLIQGRAVKRNRKRKAKAPRGKFST